MGSRRGGGEIFPRHEGSWKMPPIRDIFVGQSLSSGRCRQAPAKVMKEASTWTMKALPVPLAWRALQLAGWLGLITRMHAFISCSTAVAILTEAHVGAAATTVAADEALLLVSLEAVFTAATWKEQVLLLRKVSKFSFPLCFVRSFSFVV